MPRKRQLDPAIWTSEQFMALSHGARLLFIGLISNADDEGRIKAGDSYLKAIVFPSDNIEDDDIMVWRHEITEQELVHLYSVNGKEYVWLPTFLKYQYINRKVASKLPAPNSCTPHAQLTEDSQRTHTPIGTGTGTGTGIGTGNSYSRTVSDKHKIERFNLFWEHYPRKKSKGRAEKAFSNANPDEQLLATMLATIERAKKSDDWQREGGRFIPYPATWLNAKGWEDEYTMPQGGEIAAPETVDPRIKIV